MGKYTDWAIKKATTITNVGGTLTDEQALENINLYVPWMSDIEYKNDNIVTYNEGLYRCILQHESKETWTPDVSPSLWVRISDPVIEWPDWVQPLGSTDAYSLGDKVTHIEKHWISDTDNNVWEPGVYGWAEVTD